MTAIGLWQRVYRTSCLWYDDGMTTTPSIVCAWFARCPLPAIGTIGHPIIGQVPVCAECHAWNVRMASRPDSVVLTPFAA